MILLQVHLRAPRQPIHYGYQDSSLPIAFDTVVPPPTQHHTLVSTTNSEAMNLHIGPPEDSENPLSISGYLDNLSQDAKGFNTPRGPTPNPLPNTSLDQD